MPEAAGKEVPSIEEKRKPRRRWRWQPPRLQRSTGLRSREGRSSKKKKKAAAVAAVAAAARERRAKPVPPWFESGLIFERVSLEKKKDEYTGEELRRRATEKINSLACQITIFTDGSTDHKQENGGAGIYIEDNRSGERHELIFPAGEWCSSFGAECKAMAEALKWLTANLDDAVICTDSLSMHSALMSNDWRNKTNLIVEIKRRVKEIGKRITLLWIPAHCDLLGNDRADDLAKQGSKMRQDDTPVTFEIAKARINRRKWQPTHTRAMDTYQERRQPRADIEKIWPRRVRTLFARLRSGHAKELRQYMYLIDQEDSPTCQACEEDDETIEHVLCHCPALGSKRRAIFPEQPTVAQLTKDPEKCRQLLQERFEDLKLNTEKPVNVGRPSGRRSEPAVALA